MPGQRVFRLLYKRSITQQGLGGIDEGQTLAGEEGSSQEKRPDRTVDREFVVYEIRTGAYSQTCGYQPQIGIRYRRPVNSLSEDIQSLYGKRVNIKGYRTQTVTLVREELGWSSGSFSWLVG